MATNFGKRLFKVQPETEKDKEVGNALMREWSAKPMHRWLPYNQIETTGFATITHRQADFLTYELHRKGVKMHFAEQFTNK